MSLKLRPPIALWKDLRELTKWCTEALVDGVVGTTNLDDNAVTLPKIQQVATDTLLGRSTAGTGNVETITCTAAGRALLDDAAASNQRTTLGLGTAATQNTGTSGANVPLLNGANTWSGVQTHSAPIGLAGYTVATLPAGVIGYMAYVTDATLPAFLTTVVGGGAVVTPVFYNGANWVAM